MKEVTLDSCNYFSWFSQNEIVNYSFYYNDITFYIVFGLWKILYSHQIIGERSPLSYNSMIPLSYYTITWYSLQHQNSHNNSKINYHSSENTIKRSWHRTYLSFVVQNQAFIWQGGFSTTPMRLLASRLSKSLKSFCTFCERW